MARKNFGQSAIEFLATYGWAVLIILAFVAALYYFGAFSLGGVLPRQCEFQPGFSCDSFKLMMNESGMQAAFFGYNGLGYDIGFDENAATLTAENLGLEGTHVYTGNCSPSVVGKGMSYSCVIDIAATDRLPRLGDRAQVEMAVSYRNCETDENYASTGDCSSALSRTLTGFMRTQVEEYALFTPPTPTPTPTPTPECETISDTCAGAICSAGTCMDTGTACACCGDLVCNDTRGEGYTNCPGDCCNFTSGTAVYDSICHSDCDSDPLCNAEANGTYVCYNSTHRIECCMGAPIACGGGTPYCLDGDCVSYICNNNGTCDPAQGENYTNCPSDCPPPWPACAPNWIVQSCPCILNVPGSYTINESGLGPYSGTCITIPAAGSGSIIDCEGRTITYTGSKTGYGIYLSSATDVTVRNCTVISFPRGIFLLSSSNNRLINNTLTANYFGINLESSSDNNLIENNASSNSAGIYLYSSCNNNNITNNIANSNTEVGIQLYNSSGNNLTGNTANLNGNNGGISIGATGASSYDNNLTSNTVRLNPRNGIVVIDSYGILFDDNTVCNNNQEGGSYFDLFCGSSSSASTNGGSIYGTKFRCAVTLTSSCP